MEEPNLEKAGKEAEKEFERTKEYLSLELKIIENQGWDLGNHFLMQFPERAKDFILGIKKEPEDLDFGQGLEHLKEESLVSRTIYLSKINDYLIKKSEDGKYFPANGSFWESVGETLKKLASEIKEDIRYRAK